MRRVLHIRTRQESDLAYSLAALEGALPETVVETVDLTVADPDYDALLERIYRADSIQVW